MSISGTQCQDVDCPQTALDCQSICTCWNGKKILDTTQTQLLNGKCHMCRLPGGVVVSPLMITPLPQSNLKEDTKIPEIDEDN